MTAFPFPSGWALCCVGVHAGVAGAAAVPLYDMRRRAHNTAPPAALMQRCSISNEFYRDPFPS